MYHLFKMILSVKGRIIFLIFPGKLHAIKLEFKFETRVDKNVLHFPRWNGKFGVNLFGFFPFVLF